MGFLRLFMGEDEQGYGLTEDDWERIVEYARKRSWERSDDQLLPK